MKVGAITLGLTVALGAHAETPREELVHSYHLLQKADRDYAGHKAKAMEAEAAAGHDLGLDLGGALPDVERQWKSDQQLAEARRDSRASPGTSSRPATATARPTTWILRSRNWTPPCK